VLVDFLQEIAKIVTMLVAALLPLLALTERLEDEEELARRYNVHQENDFRAPDFDLSQLKVLFSGKAEVPGCPEEHQHLTVYE